MLLFLDQSSTGVLSRELPEGHGYGGFSGWMLLGVVALIVAAVWGVVLYLEYQDRRQAEPIRTSAELAPTGDHVKAESG